MNDLLPLVLRSAAADICLVMSFLGNILSIDTIAYEFLRDRIRTAPREFGNAADVVSLLPIPCDLFAVALRELPPCFFSYP